MSKELEAFNRIKKIEIYKEEDYYDPDDERTIGLSGYEYQGSVEEEYANEIAIIETALKNYEKLKTSYLENLLNEQSKEYIYKKLKAFEIIKEKDVDIVWLKLSKNLIEYNFHFKDMKHLYYHLLTQEEFDLLKEVLL